jgi:hypothetical protein
MREALRQTGRGIVIWLIVLLFGFLLNFVDQRGLLPRFILWPLAGSAVFFLLVGPFILVKQVVKDYMLRHDRVPTMDLSEYGYKQDENDV